MQPDQLPLDELIELRHRVNALIRSKLTPENIAENREAAAGFLETWERLHDDKQ